MWPPSVPSPAVPMPPLRRPRTPLGHFAYILEGMKDLNTLRPYHIRLTADGEVLDGDYLFGAVCNSTSIGGLMKLDPERVVLDDGKFEMLLSPAPRQPRICRIWCWRC